MSNTADITIYINGFKFVATADSPLASKASPLKVGDEVLIAIKDGRSEATAVFWVNGKISDVGSYPHHANKTTPARCG